MPRRWTAQGVAHWNREPMARDSRAILGTTLNTHGIEAGESFFRAVEEAVAHYRAARAIAENSRPAPVRDRLSQLTNAAEKVHPLTRKLDANTAHLLREAGMPQAELQAAIDEIVRPIERARQAALDYQGGWLPDAARLTLAV